VEEGTTTVEAKSGYGLTAKDETKSLQAIRDAAQRWPGTAVSTLLAAHVAPPEFAGKEDEYVELICREIIPQMAKQRLADFVDVFVNEALLVSSSQKKSLPRRARAGWGRGLTFASSQRQNWIEC